MRSGWCAFEVPVGPISRAYQSRVVGAVDSSKSKDSTFFPLCRDDGIDAIKCERVLFAVATLVRLPVSIDCTGNCSRNPQSLLAGQSGAAAP